MSEGESPNANITAAPQDAANLDGNAISVDGASNEGAAHEGAADEGDGNIEKPAAEMPEETETAELLNLPPRHQRLEEGADSFVEVTRNDRKTHPADLISAKSWEELNLPQNVLRGIYMKGFAAPSKIQAIALPIILNSDSHLIAQAQNGAGKTATFALAMISKADASLTAVQAVAICPSRELAKQNLDVIEDLANFTTIRSTLGCPPYTSFTEGTHLISGTPGKIRDWIQKKKINPKTLRMFVLDEADVLIDQTNNLGGQVLEIAKMIKRANKTLQVLLFSATYPERVRMFAMNMAPNAHKLTMKKEDLTLASTQQFYCEVPEVDTEKLRILFDLYESMIVGQSVIFCNTRVAADTVARAMQEKGFSVTLICGSNKGSTGIPDMTVAAREQRMEEFRSGTTRVLVTTDLLSRGIDVQAITLVINYELPMSVREKEAVEYETYLHRVGRTGRFGQKGVAISFVTSQHDKKLIEDIEKYYQCNITPLPLDYEQIYEMMKSLRLDDTL